MTNQSQAIAAAALQLCLDDEHLCRRGPIPLRISSLSGSGLAVLLAKNRPALLNPSELALWSNEGRPLRLTAWIGGQSIALTAQLVWSELAGSSSDEVELIIDATGASDWPAVVAAYRGAA
ncbi:MAG: hypothetical protein HY699_22385 [Deltaproteobacteria bacterium]|nr:hypothetical protein [Deltaproteobacteria bacterium]